MSKRIEVLALTLEDIGFTPAPTDTRKGIAAVYVDAETKQDGDRQEREGIITALREFPGHPVVVYRDGPT